MRDARFKRVQRPLANGQERLPDRAREVLVKRNKIELAEFKDLLASGSLTRRQMHKILASVGVGIVAVPVVGRRAAAESSIQVFTWTVYALPELFGDYIAAYGEPAISIFGENEESLTKVRAGFIPTVAQPASFMVGRFRDAGFLKPIDTSRIPNYADILPALTTVQGLSVDGDVYAVPAAWGYNSVLYRKDLAPEYVGNETLDILWDPKYAGRLGQEGSMDSAVIQVSAMLGIEDPFHMSDADLERVRLKLIEQRPLLRFYWSSDTDMQQAVAAGEVVASFSWNSSYASLKREGIDVAFMAPKEGVLAWVDTTVLLKDGPGDEQEALDFINAFISPESGKFIMETQGFGAVNAKSYEIADQTTLVEYGLDDPMRVLSGGNFYHEFDPQVREKAVFMFEQVMAGY